MGAIRVEKAGQPDRQARAHKIVAKVKDYKQVFGSLGGERVLYDLVRFSGLRDWGSALSSDELRRKEGMCSMVSMILSKIFTNERELIEMLERMEDRRRAGDA